MSVTYITVAQRRTVRTRAGDRCEYCLWPEAYAFAPHEIDHIIAEKHGGDSSLDNLCLACIVCNLRKGTDLATISLPTGDLVPLFHPRKQVWNDHFAVRDGAIIGRTTIGSVTANFLNFNLPLRVAERKLLIELGELTT